MYIHPIKVGHKYVIIDVMSNRCLILTMPVKYNDTFVTTEKMFPVHSVPHNVCVHISYHGNHTCALVHGVVNMITTFTKPRDLYVSIQ